MSDVLKAARERLENLKAETKALEAFVSLGEKLLNGEMTPSPDLPKPQPIPVQTAPKAEAKTAAPAPRRVSKVTEDTMSEVKDTLANSRKEPAAKVMTGDVEPVVTLKNEEAGARLSQRLQALQAGSAA